MIEQTHTCTHTPVGLMHRLITSTNNEKKRQSNQHAISFPTMSEKIKKKPIRQG